MPAVLSVKDLSKTYASGFRALKSIDLDIEEGEGGGYDKVARTWLFCTAVKG